MRVSLIVAISENGVIGRQGTLPWRLPADLRRFKRLTMGHHLLMGRKTFESIGRALPGRVSIVLTRRAGYQPDGALVAGDLDSALRMAAADDEVFVIGGEQVYRAGVQRADRIYLTRVHAAVPGDVCFPAWDCSQWHVLEESTHAADEQHEYAYTFQVLERRSGAPMSQSVERELLELTERLLKTIISGDWESYKQLCDPAITAFEAEARGHLVEGLEFHRFYFALERRAGSVNTTMVAPQVRMLGADGAVVNYVRLTQSVGDDGKPVTSCSEETRVWQRLDGQWRHVHFHRSSNR
jgi:dihydrofolate reductase